MKQLEEPILSKLKDTGLTKDELFEKLSGNAYWLEEDSKKYILMIKPNTTSTLLNSSTFDPDFNYKYSDNKNDLDRFLRNVNNINSNQTPKFDCIIIIKKIFSLKVWNKSIYKYHDVKYNDVKYNDVK